ncbi:hypothetical protein K505DRAFT_341043 [Melanomma pulvis-pyrius CBS 109.77]|uniref:Uncharacterized protein n=1 Tax=Melanomma pulvis-pyrius CBS 109.77 TaxID=1314802 RepID=A0A6A6X0M4_9PLEO|nr:hypothetical protein K505DRAFT_341043 [Melanomma pulvis-pyrius CBS 109.77]
MTFLGATIAVDIFSSYIISSTKLDVLVDSPLCRLLDIDPLSGNVVDKFNGLTDYQRRVSSLGVQLAQECYNNETTTPARFRAFSRLNVPFRQERVRCSFNSSICLNDEYETGSNTAGEQVFVFFASNHQQEMLSYFRKQLDADVWSNVNFALRLIWANLSRLLGPTSLTGAFALPVWDAFTKFRPLPETKTEDADLLLIMIPKNQMKYVNPMNYPVFSAQKPCVYRLPSWTTSKALYFSDWPSSTLGCKLQYQLCFGRADAAEFCTSLGGLPGKVVSTDNPVASDDQLVALQLLVTVTFLFNIYETAMQELQASYLAGTSG